MPRSWFTAPLFILLVAATATASVIRVDHAGGGDYLTISEGVDAADEGDTVLVAPGTYTGPLNRDIDVDDGITVASEGGPDVTTVDCEYAGFAFYGHPMNLSGFTILHGAGDLFAYCGPTTVFVRNGSTVSDCVFKDGSKVGLSTCTGTNNVNDCIFLDHEGPAAVGELGAAIFRRCIFENTRGGGLGFVGPDYRDGLRGHQVFECVFRGNGGTALWFSYSGALVQRSIFYENIGGVITVIDGSVDVRNCTFARNRAASKGVIGLWGYDSHFPCSTAWVINSIFAFNECSGLVAGYPCSGTVFEDNCFFANVGGDDVRGVNIVDDPLFCDMEAGDFTLCENSPCLYFNEPVGTHMGVFSDDPGCGTCGSAVKHTSWGAIKALYR